MFYTAVHTQTHNRIRVAVTKIMEVSVHCFKKICLLLVLTGTFPLHASGAV